MRLLQTVLVFLLRMTASDPIKLDVFYIIPTTNAKNEIRYSDKTLTAIQLAKKDSLDLHNVQIILQPLTANPAPPTPTNVATVSPNPNQFDRCITDDTDLSQVMGRLYDACYASEMVVIIGPSCRLEYIATSNLAEYKRIPIITGGAELVYDMTVNSTAIKTSYNAMWIWEGFVGLCARLKWRNVFIIYDDQGTSKDVEEKSSYANGLSTLLQNQFNISSFQVPHSREEDFSVNLSILKKTARIAVILTKREFLRRYMLEACGNTVLSLCGGDYAFFSLDTFTDPILSVDDHAEAKMMPWKDITGNETEVQKDTAARQAFETVSIIITTPFEDSAEYLAFATKYRNSEFNVLKRIPTYYAAAFYDGIMFMSSLVQEISASGTALSNAAANSYNDEFFQEFTPALFTAMSRRSKAPYPGVTGKLCFDEHRIRHQDVSIYDMDPATGIFSPVAKFCCVEKTLSQDTIHWAGGGGPPLDPPLCGYDASQPLDKPGCRKLSTSEIAGIAVGCVAGLAIAICVIHFRRKFLEDQRTQFDWIMKFEFVKYPRNVQEWLRRRYTIIEDGAGGIAVADAVRAAREAVAAYENRFRHLETGHHEHEHHQHHILGERKATLVQLAKKVEYRKHGIYRDTPVTIRHCQKDLVPVTSRVLLEARTMRGLKLNQNVVRFIGASVEWQKVAIFYEYCSKGTLQDFLTNPQLNLDWIMRISVITDILRGLAFIHQSPLESHGRLTSKCCYIDARFVLKIGDHGLPSFFSLTKEEIFDLKDSGEIWEILLWTAPEHIGEYLGESAAFVGSKGLTDRSSLLEQSRGPFERFMFWRSRRIKPLSGEHYDYMATTMRMGTRQGDVFSFAIILSEIILVAKPYSMFPELTSEEIVLKVRDRLTALTPFRPTISDEQCGHPELLELICRCWSYQYNVRPSVNTIRAKIKDIGDEIGVGAKTSSVMDIMLSQMEELAATLELTILEKNKIIDEKKANCFQLFTQILPRTVAEQLRHDESVTSELYDIVTLLMCDVTNFQSLVADAQPQDIINLATDIYNYYSEAIAEFDCITVDFYNTLVLVASGLPVRNGIFNAREIGRLALTLLFKTITFQFRHRTKEWLQLRMAINTGPVMAGIIGGQNPRYCVFGETVYICHRIIAVTKGFTIRCSSTAQNLLETFGSFVLIRNEELFIKGKGMCPSYNLSGETANPDMQKLELDFRVVFPDITD